MQKELTVGIIGCGVIAPSHIESFQRLAGVRVAWACDIQEERAKKRAAEFAIPNLSTSAADLFSDPALDAVSICTGHATHADLCCAALENGKHVLCEKPLATTTRDLDRMVAAAKAHPKQVFAGVFQHRFDQTYRYTKKAIEQGCLGKMLSAAVQMSCYRPDEYYRADPWRGNWAGEGGSVMINQAIHFVDILDWITGGVREVKGFWTNRTHQGVIETEDTAVAALLLNNGALGTIETTCSSKVLDWDARLSFRGTEGAIELLNARVQRVVHTDPQTQNRLISELAACKDTHTIEHLKGYYGEGHPATIADFIDSIREARAPEITVESARRAVDIALNLYKL